MGTTAWERSTSSRDGRDILLEGLDEPLQTENLGVDGLDYNTTDRRRGRDRRERSGCGWRRGCKASQQHQAIHKGNGEEDRRSERIGGKKKTHPYEKQEMRSVLLQFIPYKNRNEWGKTKRLMFGGSPVLLEGDVRDRQFANNVTGVVVQLGRNNEKWETRVGVGNV